MEEILTPKGELKVLIRNIHTNNRVRLIFFSVFLIFSLLLKWLNVKIPWLIVEVSGLFLFINLLAEYLAGDVWPEQTVSQVSLSYFIIQIIEIFLILMSVGLSGTIFFEALPILTVYIISAFFAFTKRIYPKLITLICAIGYFALGLLIYFKILDYRDYHLLDKNLFFAFLIWAIGILACVAFYGNTFSGKLRNFIETLKTRINQLSQRENQILQKEEELDRLNQALKDEIKLKTREIKELSENFNKAKVEEEKLQSKIRKLEIFQQLSIERELKMIQLKQEIKKLNSELEKCPKKTK